jgi:UDP-N-acetylglucosamine/UDP-N-acetylgalactosamine 4-epimerase
MSNPWQVSPPDTTSKFRNFTDLFMTKEAIFHSEDLSKSVFLITGGAGFIGSHIVEYLLRYGAKEVRVLDNFMTGSPHNLLPFEKNTNFRLIEGDIRDIQTCMKACEGVDYISHQAALGSVPRSFIDPILTHTINATGFLNLIYAAKEQEVKRLVYASSSSVYGDSPTLPKVESEIGKALSPYAVSKSIKEQYADVFAKNFHMEVIGLRYFNIFGPRQSPKGEYAAVIPLFMQSLMTNTAPKIYGDGNQTRDFTFVQNAVQANIKAIFAINPDALNQVYNIACGQRISLNNLWEILAEKTGVVLNPQYVEARSGDIRDSLANVDKAKMLLDYEATIDIREGLGITYEWFQSNAKVLGYF